MKHFLVGIFLCLSLACSGLAQDTSANAPATKEDVEKYFQAMHSREMMQTMLDTMAKPMHQMAHDRYLKDKDKLPPDFEAKMNKLTDDLMKEMPFDEMMAAMVPAYQKHFTRGDMAALVTFYSTPTGQKMIRELPAIMGEAMTAMMPIMRQHMDEATQRLQKEADEMLKKP
jgi:hypothetical protein